jgi:hypothetical protein
MMVHDALDPEDLAGKVHGMRTEDDAVDALRYGLVQESQPTVPQQPVSVRFGAR